MIRNAAGAAAGPAAGATPSALEKDRTPPGPRPPPPPAPVPAGRGGGRTQSVWMVPCQWVALANGGAPAGGVAAGTAALRRRRWRRAKARQGPPHVEARPAGVLARRPARARRGVSSLAPRSAMQLALPTALPVPPGLPARRRWGGAELAEKSPHATRAETAAARARARVAMRRPDPVCLDGPLGCVGQWRRASGRSAANTPGRVW